MRCAACNYRTQTREAMARHLQQEHPESGGLGSEREATVDKLRVGAKRSTHTSLEERLRQKRNGKEYFNPKTNHAIFYRQIFHGASNRTVEPNFSLPERPADRHVPDESGEMQSFRSSGGNSEDDTLHLSTSGRYVDHPIFSQAFGGLSDRRSRGGHSHNDVLLDFLEGKTNKGRTAYVPGGRRLWSKPSLAEGGAIDLFSYETIIGRRHENGDVSINREKYSTSTSKWQNKLLGWMNRSGYRPSGEQRTIMPFFKGNSQRGYRTFEHYTKDDD